MPISAVIILRLLEVGLRVGVVALIFEAFEDGLRGNFFVNGNGLSGHFGGSCSHFVDGGFFSPIYSLLGVFYNCLRRVMLIVHIFSTFSIEESVDQKKLLIVFAVTPVRRQFVDFAHPLL